MFETLPRPTNGGEPVHLELAQRSMHNNSFQCDALGIHYEISTVDSVTTLKRWDKMTLEMEEIGKIEWAFVEDCRFHLKAWGNGEEMKLRLASEWLVKTKGSLSVARTFTALNGKQYRWRFRNMNLVLYHAEDSKDEPGITFYHRSEQPISHLFRVTKRAYLEIYGDGMEFLDELVLSFVYMERWRRFREKETA